MTAPRQIQFGAYRFDPTSGELYSRDNRFTLLPKDSALLFCLLSQPGELVTKQELLAQVWKGIAVSEGVIKTCIKRLRMVLEDDSKNPAFIETIHRRGYRFICPVEPPPMESPPESAEREFSEIVGREREIARLQEAFEHASKGQTQFVFVTGEAGIGKSSVVDLFAETVHRHEQTVIARGYCVDTQGPGEAYGPLFEALESLARTIGYDFLRDLMRRYAPMWLAQLPWLLDPGEIEQLSGQLLGTTGERMLRELVMIIEALCREKTIILILEDLHWADNATLDALAVLAQRLVSAKLLIMTTFRPAEAYHHPIRKLRIKLSKNKHCAEIALPLLTEEDVDLYLSLRFADRVRPMELAGWLMQCTGGNPLFLKALLTHAMEQGWLRVQGQLIWEGPVADDTSCNIPTSLREVISEQFERLSTEVRRHLEQASVAGMSFPTRILCEDPMQEETALDELFNELVKGCHFIAFDGLVTWPDALQSPRYAFVHAWYQQVVYDRISLLRRQKLHRLIGERLENIFGDLCSRIAPVLAMHFELGRNIVKAVTYHRMAGEVALRRHAYQEVEAHLTRGLELLELLPEKIQRTEHELPLRVILGSSLSVTRGYSDPEVERTFSRARMLTEKVQGTAPLLPILNGLWGYYFVRSQFDIANELNNEFVKVASQDDSTANFAYAQFMECFSNFYQGHFKNAKTYAEKCLSLSKPDDVKETIRLYGLDPYSGSLAHRGIANWYLGYPIQGLKDVQKALEFADATDSPASQAAAIAFMTWFHIMCKDTDQAMMYADRLVELTNKHGIAYYKFHGAIFKGYLNTITGQHGAGIDQIKREMNIFEKSGAQLVQTVFLTLLAEAHSKAGNIEEGLDLLHSAREEVENSTAHWSKAEYYRIKGDFLYKAARNSQSASQILGEAEGCYQRSLDVARHQEAKSLELRAAMSLSQLWYQQGKQHDARALLEGIYQWFTEGFDTRDLMDAKALLESLL